MLLYINFIMLISEIPIYCINLQERPERKQNAIQELEKIHIDKKNVIFLEFHKHKKGGCYGCYDSHMKVWNDFYKNHKDKEMCIIFEDDFEVTENSKKYLKKAIRFIEQNKDDIDVLFLHNYFIKANEKSNDTNNHDINNKNFTNGYGLLAHAYIITRKYIRSVLKKNNNILPLPEEKIQVDIDINFNDDSMIYTEKIYYCNKQVFIQNNHISSDNTMNFYDKTLRSVYGNEYVFKVGLNILKLLNKLIPNNDSKIKQIYLIYFKIYQT